VLEVRARIQWNETRKRLKFSIPTTFRNDSILCEIPGGTIRRPSDAQEHVHGRWSYLEGTINGNPTGFGVVHNGMHGFDYSNGELRLSVLRSAAFCHEQNVKLDEPPAHKFMDQGLHDVRLLITAGDPGDVLRSLPGLADWLNGPPAVYTHLPIGERAGQGKPEEFLSLGPATLRMLACKRSEDRRALILRLQETLGRETKGVLELRNPRLRAKLSFKPFELKTVRITREGKIREVAPIEET
jgi:alpha-mannosidase